TADTYSDGAFRPGGWLHAGNTGMGIALDRSCLEAHSADPAPCHDAVYVLANHLATPLFLRQALFDEAVLNVPPALADDIDYRWREGRMAERVWWQTFDYLRGFMRDSALATCVDATFDQEGSCPIPPERAPSVYVTATADHDGLTDDAVFGLGPDADSLYLCRIDHDGGSPLTLAEAIRVWAEDGESVPAIEGSRLRLLGEVFEWRGTPCPETRR
ncbi:MAG: hypothetical protein AAF602_07890, partial [Myxococcota bacterium]